MSEAVALFTNHCFKEYGLKRVYATTFLFNKPSQKVLESAGFTLEGRLRKNHFKDGKYFDSLLYAKVK